MTDLEIARSVKMQPIEEIALKAGIDPADLELYGKYKAKLPLKYINESKFGKLVLVSATTPSPAGEGKTTISIGLSQALNRIGKKSIVVLREPSLGPVFGIKGGAAGGGYSQVLPMDDINLHFTGDFSAIEKAHNLLSAIIDNNIKSKTRSLKIDPRTIVWKRVMDMNDRSLRCIVTGIGDSAGTGVRETGFDITAASEVMAILCLSESITDLKKRLGNIFIGYTYDRKPVYVRDLKVSGAMAALLKDAFKPNLVQTIEGTPAIIHGGPFANIAQGTNTVVATKTAMSLADYTVTEAGFAFDLGAEKFIDIKCRSAKISPNVVVLVTTARALRYHGGQSLKELTSPNVQLLAKGIENLDKHIENVGVFGLSPVVAINKFSTDTPEEIEYIVNHCKKLNIPVAVTDVWAKGGEGAEDLAKLVVDEINKSANKFEFLYSLEQDVKTKIEIISKSIYGANSVNYTLKAKACLKKIEDLGLENLAICMAKTQKSLSDNPDLLGRPRDFAITVRDIEIAAGAGFLVPITGDIMRMPGLPEIPSSENIDIDDDGNIDGLF